MIENPLLIMAILTLGLAFLGEWSKAGIYFLAALAPLVYMVLIISHPFFLIFAALLGVLFIVKAFAPKQEEF